MRRRGLAFWGHVQWRRPGARTVAAIVSLALVLGVGPPASAVAPRASAGDIGRAADAVDLNALGWRWPVPRFKMVRPYAPPAHAYGPGHRGIDLELLGSAVVAAPAGGVIAFAGAVAGRGVVTIDHGGGLVSTLEPVVTELAAGAAVAVGDSIGTLSVGGHAAAGTLHFGVRKDGEYINPLLLLGGVPRSVLLPCCA